MSTFLELCQDAARECSIAGGESVPVTVVDQSGELQKIIRWVIQSYKEIQNLHNNWRWMRLGFTIQTVADQDSYAFGAALDDDTGTAITRFSEWRVDDPDDLPKFFLTSAGVGTEGWLLFREWNDFKYTFKIGTQVSSAPSFITINPENEIVLGNKPDDIYTISGDYQRSIQTLDITNDDDEPEMPAAYHDLIVWSTVIKYGISKSAQEVVIKGEYYYFPLLSSLRGNQLPPMTISGPMA